MKKEYFQAVETLEALYFFTQSLEGKALVDITKMRAAFNILGKKKRKEVLKAIKDDVTLLRKHYGAIASNKSFRRLLAEARETSARGNVYIPKLYIDRVLFGNYEKVFPRWPNVPEHGYAIFDPDTNRRIIQIFTLEGAMFDDAEFLLERASAAHKGVEDFRKRSDEEQLTLLIYLRSAIAATFHFLEAYLNGLGFDCFQVYHDELPIKDHNLLAEWDSNKKLRRFVAFETKVYEYPKIVGRMLGMRIDLSKSKEARFLVKEGKQMRDALTHPSPYADPHTGKFEKMSLVAGIDLPFSKTLFNSAKEYVLTVEKELGRDHQKTMPWLLNRDAGPHPKVIDQDASATTGKSTRKTT